MTIKSSFFLLFFILTVFNNYLFSQCWTKIATSATHSLGIKNDGTLWGWGTNYFGQLGDNINIQSNTARPSPIQIGTSNDWSNIACGDGYSLALKTNGTIWSWGWNVFGQLGDGTNSDHTIPAQVGIASDWSEISTTYYHVVAIKSNGTLWGWGWNNQSQLGDGTTVNRNLPFQIGTSTDWKSVSAAAEHTMAIKTGGTLWGWGRNNVGQLGDGTGVKKTTPTQIGIASDWAKISCGYSHTLGIKLNSTLFSSGLNDNGQLGDGSRTNKFLLAQRGVAADYSKIIGGPYHSVSIKVDGTLWAWGSIVNSNSPSQIGSSTDWQEISSGLCLKTDCSLWNLGVSPTPVYSKTYVFTGTGNWDLLINWQDNIKPPQNLPAGSIIIINPEIQGECILNTQQTISNGAAIRVIVSRKFRILGDLVIQ